MYIYLITSELYLLLHKSLIHNYNLTLLGPQASCNIFLRFFSASFVFDINYEKLQLKFFHNCCQFPGKFRDTDVPLVLNGNFS